MPNWIPLNKYTPIGSFIYLLMNGVILMDKFIQASIGFGAVMFLFLLVKYIEGWLFDKCILTS